MDEDKKLKKTTGDYAYAIAKAGIGSIPIVGKPISEILSLIISPPLEKRRQKWMNDIGERLKALEEKEINLEDLRENPIFIDTVLYATQIALRTSEEEKLNALKNAIISTAINETPDESLIHIFLNFIDTYTIWHIRILHIFNNPIKWFKNNQIQFVNLTMGGLSNVIEKAYPALIGKREFYDLIWNDLYKNGLVNIEGLHTTMSGSGLSAKRTSEIGEQFIEFIS